MEEEISPVQHKERTRNRGKQDQNDNSEVKHDKKELAYNKEKGNFKESQIQDKKRMRNRGRQKRNDNSVKRRDSF